MTCRYYVQALCRLFFLCNDINFVMDWIRVDGDVFNLFDGIGMSQSPSAFLQTTFKMSSKLLKTCRKCTFNKIIHPLSSS